MHPVEEALGVRFRRHRLLALALTHKSAANELPPREFEGDNERLEFLGDAILSAAVAHQLYRAFPAASEGALTFMRAELVQRTSLARWARRFGLGEHVVLGRGEERSGARDRDAVLAACFEAVIGALYLDRGQAAVRSLLEPLVAEALPGLSPAAHARDAKSELQHRLQAASGALPAYRVVQIDGPEHRPVFTVEVQAGANVVARGRGPTKQAAEQEAAQGALEIWNGA